MNNSVSTNEDSGLDKNEVSIETVDSVPYLSVSDVDVDINNLEVILLSEENINNLTLETETLSTEEIHINTSKVYDSTYSVDVDLSEDFNQYDLCKGL